MWFHLRRGFVNASFSCRRVANPAAMSSRAIDHLAACGPPILITAGPDRTSGLTGCACQAGNTLRPCGFPSRDVSSLPGTHQPAILPARYCLGTGDLERRRSVLLCSAASMSGTRARRISPLCDDANLHISPYIPFSIDAAAVLCQLYGEWQQPAG